MSKRCPSCRTEVPDDARVCPNCPWSFPDEDFERAPGVATSWSPLPLALSLLAVAVLGAGWYFVGRIYHEETGPEPAPRPAAVSAPEAAPAPAAPRLTRPVAPVPDEEPPNDAVSVAAEPAKKAKPVKEWKLRGFVYDLVTLQPVGHCQISLSDLDTNAHFETSTDASGRYRAILPPLADRGYLINISAPGYVTAYLNPGTEGVREKSAGERQEICKELSTAVLQPASLQPHGATPLVTDFFIAPVSCR